MRSFSLSSGLIIFSINIVAFFVPLLIISEVLFGDAPLAQAAACTESKVQASDKQANDYYGNAVDIDGDIALVGAHREDTGGGGAGAAYILNRWTQGNNTGWIQSQKIQAGDKQAGDQFGHSVAIDGDLMVIGAYKEDSGGGGAGAAYIFNKLGAAWSQQAKIQASDKSGGDEFGVSVDIDGDTVVVGAYKEDPGGTSNAGAAYVFTKHGAAWSQQAKIQASDKSGGDEFGVSVDIDGDTVVVLSLIHI